MITDTVYALAGTMKWIGIALVSLVTAVCVRHNRRLCTGAGHSMRPAVSLLDARFVPSVPVTVDTVAVGGR